MEVTNDSWQDPPLFFCLFKESPHMKRQNIWVEHKMNSICTMMSCLRNANLLTLGLGSPFVLFVQEGEGGVHATVDCWFWWKSRAGPCCSASSLPKQSIWGDFLSFGKMKLWFSMAGSTTSTPFARSNWQKLSLTLKLSSSAKSTSSAIIKTASLFKNWFFFPRGLTHGGERETETEREREGTWEKTTEASSRSSSSLDSF